MAVLSKLEFELAEMAPVHVMDIIKRMTLGNTGIAEREMLAKIWIYFNLIGNTILLPLVVLTFLCSKYTKRHPTLVNLCITWIFSGIFSLLLFYAKQHVGPEPSNLSLCIAQASLLYGITPMWSVAVFAMFYYMVYTLRGGVGSSMKLGGNHMIVMLSGPYIAQCSFTIAALVMALHRPESVNRERRYFFCSLPDKFLFFAMTTFTLVMCIGIFVLEIMLAVTMYMNWRTMRNIGVSNRPDLPLIIRVLLFGVYVALGMAMNIISMFGNFIIVDMYAATAGTVVYLIFGTQIDVIRAWCFWKKYPPPRRPPLLPPTYDFDEFNKGSSFRLSIFTIKSRKSDKRIPMLSHSHSASPSSSIPPPLPSKDSWLMGTFLNLNTEDPESVRESLLKRGVPDIGEPPKALILDYKRRKSSESENSTKKSTPILRSERHSSGFMRVSISKPKSRRNSNSSPGSVEDYERQPNNHQQHTSTIPDTQQLHHSDSEESGPELQRHSIDSNFLYPPHPNPSIIINLSESQNLQDITSTSISSKRYRTQKPKPKGPRELSISSSGGQLGRKPSTLSSILHPETIGNGNSNQNPIEPSSLQSTVSQVSLRSLPDIPLTVA